MALRHITIRRSVNNSLAPQVRLDINMLRDADVDRPKGVVGENPPFVDRVPADAARLALVEVQPQQDQQEGNADNWARSIHKSILDVITGKECGEGDCHEDTVDQVSAIKSLPNVHITHVNNEADSTKILNTRQMLEFELV